MKIIRLCLIIFLLVTSITAGFSATIKVVAVDTSITRSPVRFRKKIPEPYRLNRPGCIFFVPDFAIPDSLLKINPNAYEEIVNRNKETYVRAKAFLDSKHIFNVYPYKYGIELVKKDKSSKTIETWKYDVNLQVILFDGINDPLVVAADSIQLVYKKYFGRR